MRKLLISVLLSLASPLMAQGTATLVQHPINSSCPTTGTTCTITLTTSIGAGDALGFVYSVPNAVTLASTDNTGTLKSCPTCSTFTLTGGQQIGGSYILSAGAESTSITLTFSGAPGGGSVVMYEWSSSTGLSFDGGAAVPFSGTASPSATAFVPTGSSDVSMQVCMSGGSCNSISSPFTADTTGTLATAHYTGSGTWYQTAWSGPTWTLGSSSSGYLVAMNFGIYPTPSSNDVLVRFSGTAGTNPTAATLTANTAGTNNLHFGIGGTTTAFTYQTVSSPAPPSTATGRLADGGVYTSTGTTVIQFATGNTLTNLEFGGNNGLVDAPTVSQGYWFLSTLPATDTSHIDTGNIFALNSNDFMNAMELGDGTNRYISLECSTGQGPATVGPIARNTWYWIDELYHSGGQNIIKVYDSSLSLVGTLTCAQVTGGLNAGWFLLGNNNANANTAGYTVDFKDWLISFDGQDPLLPSSNCPGSGTSLQACTPAVADVQNAMTAATTCGATVTIPQGSAGWATGISYSPPTGCAANQGVTVQGQTSCNGSPGVPVSSCVDKTNISEASGNTSDVAVSGAGNAAFFRMSGITYINSTTNYGGFVGVGGTLGQVSFRLDHLHLVNLAGSVGVAIFEARGYGLNDHILCEPQGTGTRANCFGLGGDWTTSGYANWNAPGSEGTENAIFFEDSRENAGISSSEGWVDSYYGARFVIRNSVFNGDELGGMHGTDSGGYRAAMAAEVYDNTISDSNTGTLNGVFDSRGGNVMFFNNAFSGTTSMGGVPLELYRITQPTIAVSWGTAHAGLNWVPISTTPTNANSVVMTLNAANWAANNAYGANAYIGPTVGNAGAYNYQNQGTSCTSGGTEPATWNQTIGGTTADGTCTWTNVAGSTTASGAATAGFCAANPDTMCNADSVCSTLSTGDTCTRYLDANGGVYPYRDQPGTGHNQVSLPNYEWSNTGSNISAPLYFASGGVTAVQANRDFFDYTASFTGASGVGVGTLASRPATCTVGVAYWATDQGTWNQTPNGLGNGVLSKCTATNTWTNAYYTPYTMPHPLNTGPSNPWVHPPMSRKAAILLGETKTSTNDLGGAQ